MKNLLALILTSIIFITQSFSQSGRIENVVVHSQALEGNLLGDSPDRNVSIYLPSAYDSLPTARFSVIYLLHGFTSNNTTFLNSFNLKTAFDNHFNQGNVQPLIIVIPNAYNAYRGSWYTNSIVTGNWEDFITQELVEYVDTNYRTLPDSPSRGISGHSMGGYGAMTLAMRNPDIYSAVYSLSGASLVFEDVALGTMFNFLVEAANGTNFNGLSWQAQTFVAGGAAWSPNIIPHPFYCDFPIEPSGTLIDSVWQKWLQHDPYSMIDTCKNNLLQLDSIVFDCGTNDDYLYTANQNFDTALTVANIPHFFDVYIGTHFDKIHERVRDYMLPFFSEILDSLQMPAAPTLISPTGSIDTTVVEFIWTSSYPAIDWYWFEIATNNQFTNSFIDSTITDTTYLYSNLNYGENYWWRVKAHNAMGWGEFSDVGSILVVSVEGNGNLPTEYSLEQNYPNPFNPNTIIKYQIPELSFVTLKVFDVLGNEITTLVNEEISVGSYVVEFDASDLPSGVYCYKLQAGDFVETKKMVLIK